MNRCIIVSVFVASYRGASHRFALYPLASPQFQWRRLASLRIKPNSFASLRLVVHHFASRRNASRRAAPHRITTSQHHPEYPTRQATRNMPKAARNTDKEQLCTRLRQRPSLPPATAPSPPRTPPPPPYQCGHRASP
jgi:hypothetical protein